MTKADPSLADPLYPSHVVARRAERRWMARVSLVLFLGFGTLIALAGVVNGGVAQNIATIWPLLATLFGTEAAIVCAYFGAGAAENNKVEGLVALAGKLVR